MLAGEESPLSDSELLIGLFVGWLIIFSAVSCMLNEPADQRALKTQQDLSSMRGLVEIIVYNYCGKSARLWK